MGSPAHGRARRLLVLLASLAALAALGPASVQAATFTVNTTDDASDVNPGDGVCNATIEGSFLTCPLRAAIEEANAFDGTDRIDVPNPGDGIYELTTSTALEITTNMQIVGESARTVRVRMYEDIDLPPDDRVFLIGPGATVTLQRLSIENGNTDGRDPGGDRGGNIYNQGTLLILESTISEGSAARGGGIANFGGQLTIEQSTLMGNRSTDPAPDGLGGAIVDLASKAIPDPLRIENSTISGNFAREGAGIFISSGADLELENTTITLNNAADRGGGVAFGAGRTLVHNSIVANNAAKVEPATSNCAVNENALIDSIGFNIESGRECDFTDEGDQQAVDPNLGPLENNDGETDTHPLPQDSAAVDTGDPLACPRLDQRGIFRPQGKACDVGAYEFDFPPDTEITGGPTGPTNDSTPTFSFRSLDVDIMAFQCSVDSEEFSTCSSPFTVTPALPPGPHTFEVQAVDRAGNVDDTPAQRNFTVDTTGPGAPSVTDTDPNSPANENNPEVKGSAEAGSTVRLYTTSDCSGNPVATGTAAAFANPGLTVNVANNTTTNFRATATDAAGNTSPCSAARTYVEDSTAPTAPTVTDTDPDSPANENNPEVKGTAEAGSTVRLYTTANCTGTVAATGTAAAFANPGLTVTVANNTTTNFRATATDAAGNTSPCSNARAYVEDSAGPNAPTVTDTDPDSPANENNPEVKGSAEAGSTVRLFTTSDCSGNPVATGTAAAFANPGLTVTVANNTTTNFRATATDATGNTSPCSAARTYVEDSTAPAAPSVTDTDPDSPANQNQPEVKGSAEASSTVRLFTSSDCSGNPVATGTAAAFANPGLTVTVANNTTTNFRATATDAAGNTSPCSAARTYVEDSTAPRAPQITSSVPASPADNNAPEMRGSAEAGSTVRLYTTSDCSGNPVAIGTAAAFANPGLTVNVSDNTTTNFRANATDAAGNTSPCSNPRTYVEDSTGPNAPTVTDTDPDSPANENNPEVKGTAEPGSTVRLYTSSDCTGNPVATGTAAAFANPGLTVNVANNSSTNFRATATDAAGNTSPCSNPRAYVEDSTAPNAPTVTDTDPDSPANQNQPEVKGTAEAGSTVRLYTSSDCTGTVAATGTAAAFASPGLTVTVANNTTTNFRATATDAAGNTSPCSKPRTYVEDSTAPSAPSITSSVPASPANDNSPEMRGSAEAGSTVRLYTTSDCSGDPVTVGTEAAFATPGLTVNVADDTTTDFRANATDAAGNTSPCSAARTYVEDSTGPNAPTVTDTDPDSPANENNPEVKGTAEPGSTVRLYTTSDCTGNPVATGTAAAFANPGLTVPVADNTATNFRAAATDGAGIGSPCSNPLAYAEDSTSPETSMDSGPSGAINDATPTFTFSSTETGATFRCRLDGGEYAPCTSPYSPPGALPDGPHVLEVEAIDPAGNIDGSSATRSFTVDTRAPETTILTGPDGLTTDSTPTFEFSSDETGSTFQCQIDEGEFTDCTSPFTTPTLASGPHTFRVRAIDLSGNVDTSPAVGFDTAEFTLLGQNPGPPELGESFNLEEASGEIYVSVPTQTGTARAQAGVAQVPPDYESPIKGRVFVPLEEVRQLPVGSFVDTRFGTSRLISARNARGRTQAGRFSQGVFQVLQSRARRAKGLTTLKLKGGSFNRCRTSKSGRSGSASAAQVSRRTIRRMRSNANGNFQSRGRHSSATVRGTVWITADRCDGTLTTVRRGKVAVRDFRRKRTVLVGPGKRYLAEAP